MTEFVINSVLPKICLFEIASLYAFFLKLLNHVPQICDIFLLVTNSYALNLSRLFLNLPEPFSFMSQCLLNLLKTCIHICKCT
jgi:hypothetical protein